MTPLWAAACGYGAAVFSVISAFTQGRRVVRVRSTDGIATWSWILASASSIAWLAYSVSVRSPQQILANGSWMFPVAVFTWYKLIPKSRVAAQTGIVIAIGFLIFMLGIGMIAKNVPGWFGMVFSLSMTTPQVIYTLRHGRGPGISLPGWVFLTFSSFLWLMYGIGAQELPVVFNTSIGTVLALCVVIALILDRSPQSEITEEKLELTDDRKLL